MELPLRLGFVRWVSRLRLLLVVLLLVGRSPSVKAAESAAGRLAESESKLGQYLKERSSSSSSSCRQGTFHVQGWRWHTMSLVREADRLQKLALRTLEETAGKEDATTEDRLEALRIATDYVVGFNMKGLHKIEKDLFFPWVREKTCNAVEEKEIRMAITDIMDKLERDRQKLELVGASMNNNAAIASASKQSPEARQKAMKDLAKEAGVITETASSMLKREETFLVPVVAQLVPDSEQKAFNNRVIRKLGILQSRLHLVSMHEAVQHDEAEQRLFQETIPAIPQMMIPRWKRLMYEPRVSILATVD